MNLYKNITILSIFTLLSLQTACLKTRAQLQEDGTPQDQISSHPISSTSSSRKSSNQPTSSYEIDEIKAEITRLTGRLESIERQGNNPSNSEGNINSQELNKINNRLDELEKAQIELISRLKAVQVTSSVDPNELYNNAVSEYDKKNFQKTIEILNVYLNGNKPRKESDATFLRADAYFNLQEYKRAIMDYSKFAESKFGKTHKKNPAALYQIALSFEKLGMKDESNIFYKDLLDRYPASSQAKSAQKKVSPSKKTNNKKTATPTPPSKRKPSSLEEEYHNADRSNDVEESEETEEESTEE